MGRSGHLAKVFEVGSSTSSFTSSFTTLRASIQRDMKMLPPPVLSLLEVIEFELTLLRHGLMKGDALSC